MMTTILSADAVNLSPGTIQLLINVLVGVVAFVIGIGLPES